MQKSLSRKLPKSLQEIWLKKEKESVAVSTAKDAEEPSLPIVCDQCDYSNTTEKGLNQHVRMKHRISQVDGNEDFEEGLTRDSDESIKEKKNKADESTNETENNNNLVVLKNCEKEGYLNIHLLSQVLMEPPHKVYCKIKGVGVYEFTCPQGSFCYKFKDGDIMEC